MAPTRRPMSTPSSRSSNGPMPSASIARRCGCDLGAWLGAARFFFGAGFDRFHVVVAHAEVMADLVDQHVPHDMRQVFVRFAPIVEDRAAVEEDAVDVVGDVA